MSDPRPHRAFRALPLADLPLAALLAGADELARRWAILLLTSRPLERMGEVPLEELACEGPRVCAQLVRALASDADLDRLTDIEVPRSGEASAPAWLAHVAGTGQLVDLVAVVEALRTVVWETLTEELRSSRSGEASTERSVARRLVDASDRLAFVCASILAAAAERIEREVAAEGSTETEANGDLAAARTRDVGAVESVVRTKAVLVDEHLDSQPSRSRGEESRDRSHTAPPIAPSPSRERPISWDESPPIPPPGPAQEIEIRDERGEHGAAAWMRLISRQLERFEYDGRPFATLLVELDYAELSYGRDAPETSSTLVVTVESVLSGELRARGGSVTQERPGRYWVLAPETDRREAESLAERLTRAVRVSMGPRGSAMDVTIGTAICPDDARETAALAAHADVGLYAARSAARVSGPRPRRLH